VTGLFTSVDPVPGGNTTAYAYPQDPVNEYVFRPGVRGDSITWNRVLWSSRDLAFDAWSLAFRGAVDHGAPIER
jgi:hypothetical protein